MTRHCTLFAPRVVGRLASAMARHTRRTAAVLALVAAVGTPDPVAAQFDLGGFVGTVTLTHYDYPATGEYEGCPMFLCMDAVVASGRDASGDFFAKLVRFDPTYDTEAYDNEWVTHLDFEILAVWLEYQEPYPTDPDEGVTVFHPGEGDLLSDFHASPVIPGRMDIEFVESHLEPDGEFGTDWWARYEPTSVTRMTAAPEPMTLGLVGTGLAALGLVARRRRAR